ncbi:hypothetical protein MN116_004534 [Schistosoma mekongi]|uniref:Uncharacterized protein n=1 Tax=Schistosoma mekongi TaxID=38744 RepID=A0AAE1ZHJ6_SCHME|nr:hypothetical protein MN116_004534 [Schistosoma mekongi]
MLSNCDRLSNCTASTPNQPDYISRPSRLDNTPVTPWVRGQVIHEGMAPIDRGYVNKNIFGRRYYTNNNNSNMKFYYSGTGGGNGSGEGYNYQGRKGGRMTNRYYYHAGQRIYYNNNNTNNNNNRSRCPSTHSQSTYPLSRSQSSYNIDYNMNSNSNSNDYYYYYKNNGRTYRLSNCSYTMNNEQPTDEYIDDCLSTDIEQYQLKFDMNNSQYDVIETELLTEMKKVNNVDTWIKTITSSSPSTDSDFISADISQSSTSPLNNPCCLMNNVRTHNELHQLREKSKSSLNLSTQNIIVTNDQIDANANCEEEEEEGNNDDVVYVKTQRKSIEDNDNQKDYKSTNMNDYLTLVWSDLPGTLETN